MRLQSGHRLEAKADSDNETWYDVRRSVRRTPLASLQEEGDDEPDGDEDDSAAKTKAKSNANSVLIKLFIGDAIRPRKLE